MTRSLRTFVPAALALALAPLAHAGVSGNGLIVLSPSAQSALSLSGSSTVQCPDVRVNSTAAKAVTGSGSAVIDTPSLKTCGECSFSGSAHCTSAAATVRTPLADPGASLQLPSTAGMTDRGTLSISGGTRSVTPGYFSGGIAVSGGANVTFKPGTYILGGGLNVSSSSITGQGVCFVVLGGRVNLSGGSSATLTPPTAGALAGVLIAQPPSNSGTLALSGSSGMSLSGAIWAPGAKADLSGSSKVGAAGPQFGDVVVVNTVSLSGSGSIKVGRSQQQPGPAVPLPTYPAFD